MPLLSRRATAALDARAMRGHNGAVVARLSGMHPGAFLSPANVGVRHDKALQLRPNEP